VPYLNGVEVGEVLGALVASGAPGVVAPGVVAPGVVVVGAEGDALTPPPVGLCA
jgi:hypothetical protein